MRSALDYLDADVGYLLGMLLARGELTESEGAYKLIIHFPKGALLAQGETLTFDTDKEIRVGIEKVRERLLELTAGDLRTVDAGQSWDLIVRLTRRTVVWRDICMLLDGKTSFPYFSLPEILLHGDTPLEIKRDFVRGYADVAGNLRPANVDWVGRHRVRLDTLNHPTNWRVPVQLCLLLQEGLGVPVQVIQWDHPNLGHQWREHQLNVYAEDFVGVGFYFDYKQAVLEELAEKNTQRGLPTVAGCPGARKRGPKKPPTQEEQNAQRLDPVLVGNHFDAYWQICRALGCPRRPVSGAQLELIPDNQQ